MLIGNSIKKGEIRALLLFSGGLDSILAAEILKRQGIDVFGIVFSSYFLDSKQAFSSAEKIGLKLREIDISEEQLKIVKFPKYGYGSSINPCIDCRILMLRQAKKYAEERGFNIIATGEVLGQRPMTQNKKALGMIEKEAILSRMVLRPLSAKLLPETVYEQNKMVKRDNLFGIFGRSRKKQIRLAEEWGISGYPSPAGGCLLTELEFGRKLRELISQCQHCQKSDFILLKIGRHFWPIKGLKTEIVVGRNEKENMMIKELAQKGDILIEMENYSGPVSLIRSYSQGEAGQEKVLEKAKFLIKYYSRKSRQKNDIKFIVSRK